MSTSSKHRVTERSLFKAPEMRAMRWRPELDAGDQQDCTNGQVETDSLAVAPAPTSPPVALELPAPSVAPEARAAATGVESPTPTAEADE